MFLLHEVQLKKKCHQGTNFLYVYIVGYVAGTFRFRFEDSRNSSTSKNAWVDGSAGSDQGAVGISVSSLWSNLGINVEIESTAKCILVIEKVGVFRRLCEDKFYK